ncbi:hypothetical protein BgiMline_012627 [Biomphalaria glabrata]|nr:hypothetical protein BgiMline_016488 [Biomphalaria glabrata]
MIAHFLMYSLIISSLVSLGNGQYSFLGQYQNSQWNSSAISTCNDLHCSPNECCVETHRAPVCVALKMSASGQALCARLKKCFNSDHCPISAPCCSQALEPTFATTCPGGNTNGPSYISSNGYNNKLDNTIDSTPLKEGYCRAAADTNQLCYSPVHGSEKAKCPCSADGDFCKITLEPFVTGICI